MKKDTTKKVGGIEILDDIQLEEHVIAGGAVKKKVVKKKVAKKKVAKRPQRLASLVAAVMKISVCRKSAALFFLGCGRCNACIYAKRHKVNNDDKKILDMTPPG